MCSLFLIGRRDRRILKSAGGLILAAGVGFVLPILLMWFSTDMNLFAVWWRNYHNHAEFYQHFPRSYTAWLLVNPVETSFALGAPAAVLFLAAWVRLWKDQKLLPRETWGPYLALALVMAFLWITGKNRGEAARLWLVVFPYFLWLSARIWEPARPRRRGSFPRIPGPCPISLCR